MWYVTAMPTDTTTPAVDPRDAQIADLKAQLSDLQDKFNAEAKTHAYQAKRADDLQVQLTAATAKGKAAPTSPTPKHDHAVVGGVVHRIIGNFRAGNTFEEVKKGHCPEGVTLLAIEKAH